MLVASTMKQWKEAGKSLPSLGSKSLKLHKHKEEGFRKGSESMLYYIK